MTNNQSPDKKALKNTLVVFFAIAVFALMLSAISCTTTKGTGCPATSGVGRHFVGY